MAKIAVILFGTPGSGKGMQADLLAAKYGLVHVDTGQVIRNIFANPLELRKKSVQQEKKLNDAGILNSPRWVLSILKKQVGLLARSGYGVVFSGSPRTLYEGQGLIPFLEKLYGRKNVHVFHLKVPAAQAAKRNADRLVCTVCRRPLLAAYYPVKNAKHCPVCAGPLVRRKDDDPAKYQTRYGEYVTRTKPVIDLAQKRGYRVHEINGLPAPYKVFADIGKHLPK